MIVEYDYISSYLNSFGAHYKKEHLAKVKETLFLDSKEIVKWPWNQVLEKEKNIFLFGIGSLVNLQSALRTFKYSDVNQASFAIAFGARRLFNYAGYL